MDAKMHSEMDPKMDSKWMQWNLNLTLNER